MQGLSTSLLSSGLHILADVVLYLIPKGDYNFDLTDVHSAYEIFRLSCHAFLWPYNGVFTTTWFAFVYFEDERDAADAIRDLDDIPFGYDKRWLSVEWAKGECGRPHDGSKVAANQRPTKNLFVIKFDPNRTRLRDIERHFELYGEVLNVRIRRTFAFVQFENQEDATKALESTHMSKILNRVVSVEYALKDDDERGDRYNSPRRDYGRQRDSPYRRSPSPMYQRSRPSPDYGRSHSPAFDKYNGLSYDRYRSPEYGRYHRSPIRRSRT
ncbi:serine/arginine-rich splicing factor RS31 isoform X1 [Nicotiana tabacum]|uniref:Serine/arginine-rich splicing factor RS31 isoform X1 n=1 Tax=Nicotiana tabacum TaxID=4097 RepID=A0A1S4AU03_TOBAC